MCSAHVCVRAIFLPPLVLNPHPSPTRYTRWDDAKVENFKGRYGDYVLSKVAKVFPDLAKGTAVGPRSAY
jgi:hypothetical protein